LNKTPEAFVWMTGQRSVKPPNLRAHVPMRTFRCISTLAVVAITFVGCSGSTATPTATKSTGPTANSLTIAYEDNCQVELIAPSGQRILIDVYDPTQLTSPARSTDILLTTHLHSDHYNAAFESSFPGQKITNETKDLTVGDITIKSIGASHDDSAISTDKPSNHIFVIEFNGFKIVHSGSTGQLTLTPDQVAAIGGNVDIAALVLTNVGGSDPTSSKAIDIATQVSPKVLLATHTSLEYIQAAGKKWSATYSSNKTVTISHDQLPTQTTLLFMGSLAVSDGAILKAPETKW
jgi:L-ascorbate metabolism protein UlaG (beta-lactamase superfamily)